MSKTIAAEPRPSLEGNAVVAPPHPLACYVRGGAR